VVAVKLAGPAAALVVVVQVVLDLAKTVGLAAQTRAAVAVAHVATTGLVATAALASSLFDTGLHDGSLCTN
jgi:hypothetical protein